MHIYNPPEVPRSIPVIDIGSSDQGQVAREVHKACRETGFFYVVNHGVPGSLIDAQFEWSRRFFDLPLPQKMQIDMKRSASTCGYEPIGGQILDSQDDASEKAPPDLKESFYCGPDLPDDDPYAQRGWRSYGHNQWPDSLPGFRPQMNAYYEAMRGVGDRILSALALSLDLDPTWFEPFYEHASATLRLIKYPPHPATAAVNQIGAGAHTDWGGITLLAQDNVGGLEVRTVGGTWIAAPPIPGSLVINLGDLMARWTNGIYNSNFHRVKNNATSRDRYSIPFFYSPRPDAMIAPIPTCIDAEHPQRFEVCTAGEHMNEMFRRSYGYAPTAA